MVSMFCVILQLASHVQWTRLRSVRLDLLLPTVSTQCRSSISSSRRRLQQCFGVECSSDVVHVIPNEQGVSSMPCAQYHKAWQNWWTLSLSTKRHYTRLLTTVHQLYIHCLVENMQSAAANIEQCVAAIENWMAADRLWVNADMTKLMWLVPSTIYWRFLAVVLLWLSVDPTSSHLTSFVCWECCWLQTCRWTSTSPHSVPSAFFSCNNFAVSDARWMTTPSPDWFTRSLPTASTTVCVH